MRDEAKSIYLPLWLIAVSGALMVGVFSGTLAHMQGSTPMGLVGYYVLYVVIGSVLLAGMMRLEPGWFDRIGAAIVTIFIIVSMAYFLVPIEGLGIYKREVAIFSLLGFVWLLDYADRTFGKEKRGTATVLWGVGLVLWFALIWFDLPTALLVAISTLLIVLRRYGAGKWLAVMLAGFLGVMAYLFLGSPYRISRIKAWWDALVSHTSVPQPIGMELAQGKLHEGIFLFNDYGAAALTVMTLLFTWLIRVLWKKREHFAQSIAIVFAVDIVLHLLAFWGLFPTKPPVLLVAEYSVSGVMVSFAMVGMVLLKSDIQQGNEANV